MNYLIKTYKKGIKRKPMNEGMTHSQPQNWKNDSFLYVTPKPKVCLYNKIKFCYVKIYFIFYSTKRILF